ncbi:MAG: molybdenum cofactor guanylyltransferase MobA [Defluviimonas sp.]|uniref:molybdenum cofactor guanylyltransferase MobA n=1 Tax=Albidovulum sp. TaxID=1872424 RepID=UPI001D98ADB6|nr:molybdenum cofactor guanylyltransferase MobA [Paracoccaceae bacterium]MCC0063649.1 molybdenum cofactor guanylyltransferase MobA [Defluviimonas sp.]
MPADAPPPVLPGVILAGGRARRMDGADKALQILAGRPLLAHVAARLSAQCAPLALSANGDPDRFAGFGLPVLPDSAADHPGPLAGILAGLDWAAGLGAPAIVTVAVDTPFFPEDLARRLATAMRPMGVAVAAGEEPGATPRQHPVFAVWSVGLRDDLRSSLEAGERRVGRFAARHGAAVVTFAETGAFFNINTAADLAAAEDRARHV